LSILLSIFAEPIMTTESKDPAEEAASPFPTSTPELTKPKKIDSGEKTPHKPPEELTEEELRLMADTMPGDGPGGD
jgi:hypothetical protein